MQIPEGVYLVGNNVASLELDSVLIKNLRDPRIECNPEAKITIS